MHLPLPEKFLVRAGDDGSKERGEKKEGEERGRGQDDRATEFSHHVFAFVCVLGEYSSALCLMTFVHTSQRRRRRGSSNSM